MVLPRLLRMQWFSKYAKFKGEEICGVFSLSKVLVTDKIPSLKGALAKKEMDTTVCQLYTPRGNY